jgi:hypothetical protein
VVALHTHCERVDALEGTEHEQQSRQGVRTKSWPLPPLEPRDRALGHIRPLRERRLSPVSRVPQPPNEDTQLHQLLGRPIGRWLLLEHRHIEQTGD